VHYTRRFPPQQGRVANIFQNAPLDARATVGVLAAL